MENSPEIAIKKICCTCLSKNRKLFQLCRVNDGVNILYLLLSSDTQAYREVFFKDRTSLFICWECKAIMKKFFNFRQKACIAQKRLTELADGRADPELENESLSLLSICKDIPYETAITRVSAPQSDNFIDCGLTEVKPEIDVDDIPLAELQDYYVTCSIGDNIDAHSMVEADNSETGDIENKKQNDSTEAIDAPLKKLKEKYAPNANEYYTATQISEGEMIYYREKSRPESGLDQANVQCELCSKRFKSQVALGRHIKKFHREVQKTTLRKKDSVSKTHKRQLSKKNSVLKTRKKQLMDKDSNGYKCTHCDKYFDNKNIRYKHIRRFHTEGYPCTVCGKRYPFKDNLAKHERLHQGPMPRQECPVCKKMVRVDLVKTHAWTHGQRETHECVECDKKFVSRASYENHLKYSQAHATVDVLKYKCSLCDKGYRSKGELDDHTNYQHLGKTQHKCPICSKALATTRCITRHVRRVHEDIKESPRDKVCQQCGKAFRDKKGLREHELIHTGERPLSCEICGCTFRQSASLYTHRKRVHNIFPDRKNVEFIED